MFISVISPIFQFFTPKSKNYNVFTNNNNTQIIRNTVYMQRKPKEPIKIQSYRYRYKLKQDECVMIYSINNKTNKFLLIAKNFFCLGKKICFESKTKYRNKAI